MMRPGLLRLALLAALACAPVAARAQSAAPPDSGLGRYLGGMADSTDAYFGASAAPPDTAGLDSVLFDSAEKPRRDFGFGVAPSFDFDRVNGSTPGASAWIGERQPDPQRTGWGRLAFSASHANGPNTTLGGVRFTDRVWLLRQPFDLDLWGGRRTSNMDRDDSSRLLTLLRAIGWGKDWTQYYRSEGFQGRIENPHDGWWIVAGYQDVLQDPLDVTATWTLFRDGELEMPVNLAAARGRVRELSGRFGGQLPRVPLQLEVALLNASRRMGSDLDYRRLRASAGLDLTLGRWASLVPQLAYGRLAGDVVPQNSFYIGGDRTLRSLHRDERAGTGAAVGKVQLLGARPVLPWAVMPMGPELFAASGAVWGLDSWTGVVRPGERWPEAREWRSEVGAGLVYSSPIFPGGGAFHVNCAWPVGAYAGPPHWSFSFTTAFDLMGPTPTPVEER
jgi:hypothetical protein